MSGEDHWYFRPFREVHRPGGQPAAHVEHTLRTLATAAHPKETGGLLLGWWDGGVPIVVDAIEVPDPEATGTAGPGNPKLPNRRGKQRARPPTRTSATSATDTATPPTSAQATETSKPSGLTPATTLALALVVVRHGAPLDTRLALNGQLITATKLKERMT